MTKQTITIHIGKKKRKKRKKKGKPKKKMGKAEKYLAQIGIKKPKLKIQKKLSPFRSTGFFG